MKWTRKNSRHHYGPHWITDRKTFEKGGAILALLDYSLKWRAAWIDKLDRMHWQWFPTRSSAKEWIEQMARSKSAKQEEPEPEEAAAPPGRCISRPAFSINLRTPEIMKIYPLTPTDVFPYTLEDRPHAYVLAFAEAAQRDAMIAAHSACIGLDMPESPAPGILADVVAQANGLAVYIESLKWGEAYAGRPHQQLDPLRESLAYLSPQSSPAIPVHESRVFLTQEEREVICAKLLNSSDRREVVKGILAKLETP